MHILSTVHLPMDECAAIDKLIAAAPRNLAGRVEVEHSDLVIEPHLYGFFVHTGVVACGATDPMDISPALFAIQCGAKADGASWVLFDRDEPQSEDLPRFT